MLFIIFTNKFAKDFKIGSDYFWKGAIITNNSKALDRGQKFCVHNTSYARSIYVLDEFWIDSTNHEIKGMINIWYWRQQKNDGKNQYL